MLERFRLYEEDGKIHFTRDIMSYIGGRSRQRRYTYYVDTQELWRVYAKTKQRYTRIPTWHTPLQYIKTYGLEPVWPKHMRMDKGL